MNTEFIRLTQTKENQMKVEFFANCMLVQGKPEEQERINKWIALAQEDNSTIEIVIDETDEFEVSYTVVSKYMLQRELKEVFRQAKKRV